MTRRQWTTGKYNFWCDEQVVPTEVVEPGEVKPGRSESDGIFGSYSSSDETGRSEGPGGSTEEHCEILK